METERADPVSAADSATIEELARELIARVRVADRRIVIGIVGPPGTGKSTLAAAVAEVIGDALCRVVPLDGFHLGQSLINGTELASRKGAPDTFDVDGYLSLLARLRTDSEQTVYAPAYRREYEEPIAASIAVPHSIRIVLTEGNYLLLDRDRWAEVAAMVDERWYVDTPDELRRARLIARHIRFGKSPDEAQAWTDGPDEANARLIAATRASADRTIAWSG